MRRIDVLVDAQPRLLAGQVEHGPVRFRVRAGWNRRWFEGRIGRPWAFLDTATEPDPVARSRELRADPLTTHTHITWLVKPSEAERFARAANALASDLLVGPLAPDTLIESFQRVDRLYYNLGRAEIIEVGGLRVNSIAHRAEWQGRRIALSMEQMQLLRFLVDRPGRVFSHEEIEEALPGPHREVQRGSVNQRIGRVRRTLRGAGVPDPIVYRHERGYVFDPRQLGARTSSPPTG